MHNSINGTAIALPIVLQGGDALLAVVMTLSRILVPLGLEFGLDYLIGSDPNRQQV